MVHNTFYASGFLFNPASQQILLQQNSRIDTVSPVWSIFHAESFDNEKPPETFQRVILEELGIELSPKHIESVYDYISDDNLPCYMHYGVLPKTGHTVIHRDEHTLGWFNFRQLIRLPLDPQARQDIIVAERVINMKLREIQQ